MSWSEVRASYPTSRAEADGSLSASDVGVRGMVCTARFRFSDAGLAGVEEEFGPFETSDEQERALRVLRRELVAEWGPVKDPDALAYGFLTWSDEDTQAWLSRDWGKDVLGADWYSVELSFASRKLFGGVRSRERRLVDEARGR